MKVIVSSSLPVLALKELENQFHMVFFETEGITYHAISNHPDVFLCPFKNDFVGAANLPDKIYQAFANNQIAIKKGVTPVGMRYPDSAPYNAVVTEQLFIHQLQYSDPLLLQIHADKKQVHVNQAYTRCNLLALRDDWFISSDRGIEKTLLNHSMRVLYVDPSGILLPGFRHGFFGGTCGILGNTVFFIGDLAHLPQGDRVSQLFEDLGYQTCYLYDGPLFDGGSLFFAQ